MYFGQKNKPFDFNTYNTSVLDKYGFDKPLSQQALDFRALTKPEIDHELGDVPFGGLGIQTKRRLANQAFQDAVGEGGKATLLDPNWLTNKMVNPKDVKYHPDYGYYTNTGNVDWRDDGGFLGAAMPIIQFAGLASGAYGLANLAGGLASGGLSGIGSNASNVGGYMPNVADATWSANASIPSWLSTAGQVANPLLSAAKTIGSVAGLGVSSKPTQQTGGGIMPNFDLSNLSLGDIGSAAAPFLSAWQNQRQKDMTKDAYDRAYNLITTPSADQKRYRNQLQTLMESPGSMASSPLYQAMLESGTNAVNRSAAARGMLGSGSRLADLMKAGQQTAAQYYFPQQSALAQLSGIPQDTAQRTLGANALLRRNEDTNLMNAQTLDNLLQGIGAKSWQQKLLEGMYQGGQPGLTLGQIGSGISDWFKSTPDYTQGIPDMGNWFSGIDLYDIGSYADPGYVPELADLIWG